MKLINSSIIVGENQLEILSSSSGASSLDYQAQRRIPIFEKWLVEVWDETKLCDILEKPFDTEVLADLECKRRVDEQNEDNLKLLDNYAERLREFTMDETVEDREPEYPKQYVYIYISKKYLCTLSVDGRYHTLIYEF